ncbi:MAG: ABC transporter ATP-binding protein [Endomicrobium sp.]|jgi:lipoprotein-releasing system ATP-binding protein|uniref:ABC transporter ATP-binding protein n=1 Tax=Candidatus Endomicrobiellum cubanum TaxID=3242325 RepID=UPI002830676F|nr:ABC transporter ATP-binding protein [Endomicrobium sp.]
MNIQIKNLNKDYIQEKGPTLKVLKDINLNISSGEKVSLIGPSGAGKSTLIHIVGLMDSPTSGKVFINDIDCSLMDDNDLCDMRRKNIGFIFQFHYLLPDFTVLENILIPVWKDKVNKEKRALEILDQVGLTSKVNCLPNELSGGQQQRTALARALINNPKIIFADEPTGNLDRTIGVEIENLLFDFSKNSQATLVLVTHNQELACRTDRVINIIDGRMV